jgi:hypothetical protein
MKSLASLLATLALLASAPMVTAQTAAPEDDCKEQDANDDDACAPAVVLGGLGAQGVAIGVAALALSALALGGSGSHSGSH